MLGVASDFCFPPQLGTLTKFTLVLYGTAPEGLPTPPESIGCKTLTSSQACVGQSWVLQGLGNLRLGTEGTCPKGGKGV